MPKSIPKQRQLTKLSQNQESFPSLKNLRIPTGPYWGTHLGKPEAAPGCLSDLLEVYDALQFFHDILGSFPFSVQSEELTEWIKTYAPSDV